MHDALLEPLENKYPAVKTTELPASGTMAIVLLGGGVYEKAPEFGGRDSLNRYALMRTVFAAELVRKTGISVYATGGAPLTHHTEPEGAIMARWLVKFGVPKLLVHAEISARTTWENAGNIKLALQKQGISTLILVTSAWHMPRAVWCFRAHGLNVIPAPCAYLAERGSYDIRSYLPRWNVLDDSGQALREYLGLFWYHLRYG